MPEPKKKKGQTWLLVVLILVMIGFDVFLFFIAGWPTALAFSCVYLVSYFRPGNKATGTK